MVIVSSSQRESSMSIISTSADVSDRLVHLRPPRRAATSSTPFGNIFVVDDEREQSEILAKQRFQHGDIVLYKANRRRRKSGGDRRPSPGTMIWANQPEYSRMVGSLAGIGAGVLSALLSTIRLA